MRRLSIARSVAIALLGLTIVLAVLAGVGVASLYQTRQTYENRLSDDYELEAAAGKLLAAAVVEEATLRLAGGPAGAGERQAAQRAFASAAAQTRALAASDPQSLRLVDEVIASQASLRRAGASVTTPLLARTQIDRLAARQAARRARARSIDTSDSRRELIGIAAAGVLALVAALALVSLLIGGMRNPLAQLVEAAQRLASGDLRARVEPAGPDELRALGSAFNAMADDLAAALGRLEAERLRLSQIVESLGDALLVVDGHGRVSAANPRAHELVPELPAGASVDAQPGVLPPLEEALAGEFVLERAGRVLAATAARLQDGGAGGASTVWTVRDVTERARLEQLKSEFVATASHELRSPLTSIKGFVELLQQGPGLDAKQREFIDIIRVSTDRLVDLVNDLLDVARIESGQVEISRRPTDLSEAVYEVATMMGPRLSDKRQELAVDVAEGLPRALADPARVRQIVINLLTNAHLYSPSGGHLAVRLHDDDGYLALEIEDDGPGMDAGEIERLFDRFYRGAAQSRGSGTGLGLSIVKSLVDMHEGTIEVDSEPGRGTRFVIRLPRVVGMPSTAGHEVLRGKRVLVVDDEPDIARLISARLNTLGVEAVPVHDGREAVQRLREEEFDGVTLDVLMPGMTGFDVLRELRSDPRLAGLPVVVVSVLSAREALAGEWVVSKPIDTDQLADALGAAVTAGRVRVLVVARPEVREEAGEALEKLGIAHDWATDSAAAVRLCAQRRFEVALVDAGLPDAATVLETVDLRGRRPGRSVIVFSPGRDAMGAARLGAEPVDLETAGAAVLAALGDPRTLADSAPSRWIPAPTEGG